MAVGLGIIPHLFAQPLFERLRNVRKAEVAVYEIIEDKPAQIAFKLREEELHGAFLSPVEYAKHPNGCTIIPRLGAVSEGVSQSILLTFKEGTRQLSRIAVDPTCASEIVLAHIVLSEKFETTPQFVPFLDPVERLSANVDGVLAVDREAWAFRDHVHKLDLVDEWFDLTEMPYVHGFWTFREDTMNADEISEFVRQSRSGTESMDAYKADAEYLEPFRYDLDESAAESLSEFFRMAFYHGLLKEMPDIKFSS